MTGEKQAIELISSIMPASGDKLNKPFESDSEILNYHGRRLLVNVDEFSKEDLIRSDDPYTLGWNVAIGGISDILASGGKPLYYAHSLVIDEAWDKEFIRLFTEGAAEVLRKTGTAFIGGDFGRADEWRCTVTVLGEAENGALLRSGAKEGNSIYITGEIGAGNFEAFLSLYSQRPLLVSITNPIKNRFNIRLEEAKLIQKYATSCVDTSDGVFNSLNAIADVSHTGYAVKDIPYMNLGRMAAKLMSMPKALLFMGECGEYELLFTIRKEEEEAFILKAKSSHLNFFKIGSITKPSQKTLNENKREYDLTSLNISARDFADKKEYINKLIEFFRE